MCGGRAGSDRTRIRNVGLRRSGVGNGRGSSRMDVFYAMIVGGAFCVSVWGRGGEGGVGVGVGTRV